MAGFCEDLLRRFAGRRLGAAKDAGMQVGEGTGSYSAADSIPVFLSVPDPWEGDGCRGHIEHGESWLYVSGFTRLGHLYQEMIKVTEVHNRKRVHAGGDVHSRARQKQVLILMSLNSVAGCIGKACSCHMWCRERAPC